MAGRQAVGETGLGLLRRGYWKHHLATLRCWICSCETAHFPRSGGSAFRGIPGDTLYGEIRKKSGCTAVCVTQNTLALTPEVGGIRCEIRIGRSHRRDALSHRIARDASPELGRETTTSTRARSQRPDQSARAGGSRSNSRLTAGSGSHADIDRQRRSRPATRYERWTRCPVRNTTNSGK